MKKIKAYLNDIRYLDMSIQSLLDELEITKASFLKAANMKEDKVQESNAGTYDDKYIRYVELNDSINKEIDLLWDLKKKVNDEIKQIDDRREQIILKSRYIMNKPWKEIAIDLKCTERQVHRIHGRALVSFKDKFEEKIQSDI